MALAGPRRIQIRREAGFSDLGARQVDLPLLATAHAGATRPQK